MKQLFVLAFLLFTLSLFSQYNMKYGKISPDDLEMAVYNADPHAAAVVLGEKMSVQFQFKAGSPVLTYYYHVRIKILDKRGFDQADIKIPYYNYRRGERMAKVKAQTINLDANGKIVKTEVDKTSIFDEKRNDYVTYTKFSFPAVEVGSILEFQYEKHSNYYNSVNDYYFQRDIPVRWSKYVVDVPAFFVYRQDVQGQHPFSLRQENDIDLTLGGGIGSIDGTEYVWAMEQIPALEEEPFITSMSDYYAAVRLRLASYEPDFALHEKYISSWPALNNRYYKEIAARTYLRKKSTRDSWAEAEELLKDVNNDLEIISILYDFVQQKIEWNGMKKIAPDKSLEKSFYEGEGSNSEINLTLLGLLRKAGLEAYPLLISTRDNNKPMSLLPYLWQFNQTLVVVKVGEKDYFLDASHQHYPMEVLHPNNLNLEGWMIKNEKEGRWILLPTFHAQSVMMPTLNIDQEGEVSGTVKSSYKTYPALTARILLNTEGETAYLQSAWLDDLLDAELSNLTFENLEDNKKPLLESVDISTSDIVQNAGDLMYISPFLKSIFLENPFQVENRAIPVDMEYGIYEQYILKLNIPEKYVVEELPEAAKFVLPENAGSFSYRIAQSGNTITLICKTKVNQTFYTPEQYPALRAFYDVVANKQNEQIVLKKIQPLPLSNE